jgi:hypothetical protein
MSTLKRRLDLVSLITSNLIYRFGLLPVNANIGLTFIYNIETTLLTNLPNNWPLTSLI